MAAAWLAVEAGDAKYLFPLGHAGEIFPWRHRNRCPTPSPGFGRSQSARRPLTVVELAGFAADDAAAPVHEAARTGARLVALNELLEVNCALLIDRLVRLRGVEPHGLDAATGRSARWLGHAYTDAAGAQWQEINCRRFRSNRVFCALESERCPHRHPTEDRP